jgi:hypothetical protein
MLAPPSPPGNKKGKKGEGECSVSNRREKIRERRSWNQETEKGGVDWTLVNTTVFTQPMAGISNFSPHFRNIADMRIDCESANYSTKKVSELRLQTFKI